MDKCFRCGKVATELAHKIPQTRHNMQTYGELVIHHEMNLEKSCRDCNDYASISNHPLEEKKLLSTIYVAIGERLFEEYAYEHPDAQPNTAPSNSGTPDLSTE